MQSAARRRECARWTRSISRRGNAPPLDPANDRAMICGSLPFLRDMDSILRAAGFAEGSNANPADFGVETAFVG